VDDFYVQCLQKTTLKLDVYLSKNNAAVHLGHSEIHLRELIDRETAVQDYSMKTPVLQKTVRVFGSKRTGTGEQPLGSLRFKMRMRKPIGEVVRTMREMNAVKNMTTMDYNQGLGDQTQMGQARRKLVTIQVVRCNELSVRYGEVATVSPFFYY
jgi:First C2 domain of RPGR-interacting protein 1